MMYCFAECIRDFEIRGWDWDDACLYVPGTFPGGPRLASPGAETIIMISAFLP